MKQNLILNTDSYKPSHWLQYPPKTETVFSYIESRGGEFSKTMFFGLQAFIKEYLLTPVTQADIEEAAEFLEAHGEPFNREGWDIIVNEYDGFLPLEIRAVPEGTIVPVGNVLVTVENTDKRLFWLTSYIETALLRAIWYPTTVATISWSIKQLIAKHLKASGTPEAINFKLHDFGARGVSSFESSGLGGMAHLANFMGSDNMTAILFARKFYNEKMAGFSIPAAEHSSITSWGKSGEKAAYANMIKQFGGQGKLVAVVSDSYDLSNATKLWGELKAEIIDSGTVLIVRPDSGDPTGIVLRTLSELDKEFGSTMNAKGFKVLNHVRVIQGDGINEHSIESILSAMKVRGWSSDNLAFGMGGALLQILNRDTQKFAMKASAALVDGAWIDVFKDPVTDSGKRSKKGRLELFKSGDTFLTDRNTDIPKHWTDRGTDWKPQLRTVFLNGELLVDESFAEIRERANG